VWYGGEKPLPKGGSCLLGSINLERYVKNSFEECAEFDFELLYADTRSAITYLDEVLEEGIKYLPLQEQIECVTNYRQIGLGIMGLADALIRLRIRYGSSEAVRLSEKIGHVMINAALQQSALLAKEYGTYPKYNAEYVLKSPFLNFVATKETLDLIKKYGLRNAELLSIAPTGSISTMLGVSGGIEPIYNLSYLRKTETLHSQDSYYKVFTPIVKEYMTKFNIEREEDLPDFFVTAMTLNYRERIDMQAAFQKYIDASISSTVNVPNEFTIEEIEDLYMYAWEKGLKGITLFRDGCARSGILLNTKPKQNRLDRIDELKSELDKLALEELKENPNKCPICGSDNMSYSNGCETCLDCGYSPCSI